MPLSRRNLLQFASAGTFFLSLPRNGLAQNPPLPAQRLTFPQGVASGDPQPDSVILWTRALPADGRQRAEVLLEVSASENFDQVLLRQTLTAEADSDFTLRAHIAGLQPDRWYWYRFIGGAGSVSRTGRTRTAPAQDAPRDVHLAFASCQSLEDGYYGAWARMLENDLAAPPEEQIQFVLHLGDFIYERSWHTRVDGSARSRDLPPFPDGVMGEANRHAVSLEDYRHLYRCYLMDPDLQAARARWPFICVWDDHEFSNDNFQSYSTYESQARLQPQRKLDANQAWYEYIPVALDELQPQPAHGFRAHSLADAADLEANELARDSLCIYRRLHWGANLDIVLTDNRSYRSPPCMEPGFAQSLGQVLEPITLVEILDAGRAYNEGSPPETLPYGDGNTPNPARDRDPGTCLGATQRDWFLQCLRQSRARWKLWGNSLPLVPMRLDLSSLPLTDYEDALFNLDAWAGYPHEVALLMDGIRDAGVSGVVSLSGDHHMHAAGTVSANPARREPPVSVDFSVAGISSAPIFENLEQTARTQHPDFAPLVYRDGDEGVLPLWNMTMLDGALASFACARTGWRTPARWLGPNRANPGLAYMDSNANGYGLAHFGAEELRVSLVTVDDVRERTTEAPPVRHAAHFRVPLWAAQGSPQLAGPEFEGGAPFPFDTPQQT